MDNIGILLEMIILNILPLDSESDRTGFKKSTSISPTLAVLKRNQQNEKISEYNYFGAKEKKSPTTRGFDFVSCENVMYVVSVLVVRNPTRKSSSKSNLKIQLEILTR